MRSTTVPCVMCRCALVRYCCTAHQRLHRAQFNIIDTIPAAQNAETGQQSEPSITVNPTNTNQIVISALDSAARDQYYTSSNGGAAWSAPASQQYVFDDTTVAWSPSGATSYSALKNGGNFTVRSSATPTPPNNTTYALVAGSGFGTQADQPWIQVSRGGNPQEDLLFVGFNDGAAANGRTATVRFSADSGQNWSNTTIEKVNPAGGSDGAAVRVAVNGERAYAAFERYATAPAGTDPKGAIVVVREDNAQNAPISFSAIGAGGNGVAVANNITLPFDTTKLGAERLGSDLSIAVDPNNSNRVFVAYAQVTAGHSQVMVQQSTDGGVTWNAAPILNGQPDSALPALAIGSNGAVGLLYLQQFGANLRTRFELAPSSLTSAADSVLNTFPSGTPASTFDPYVGDYMDLISTGGRFFGAFAASNDPKAADWPNGVPTYLRSQADLANGNVPISIDPFFFNVAVPEPMSLVLAALAFIGLAAQRRRWQ